MNKTRFKSNRYAAIVALLIAMFALSPLAMAQEPQGYAEVIDGVLTFYWDADRDSRTGKTYSIPGPNQRPAWSGTDTAPNESTTKVVFDPSFINCEIQGCYDWFRQCTKLTTIEGLVDLGMSFEQPYTVNVNATYNPALVKQSAWNVVNTVYDFVTNNGAGNGSTLNFSGFNWVWDEGEQANLIAAANAKGWNIAF